MMLVGNVRLKNWKPCLRNSFDQIRKSVEEIKSRISKEDHDEEIQSWGSKRWSEAWEEGRWSRAWTESEWKDTWTRIPLAASRACEIQFEQLVLSELNFNTMEHRRMAIPIQ